MTSLKVDKDFELVFTDGICDLVSDTEDIVQAIRTELEQNKGQFALNVNWGTPYLNQENTGLLQEKQSKERILQEVSKVIKKYKGVDKIINIEFVGNNIRAEILIGKEAVVIANSQR